ncbi:Uncharacterized membrane-anchored protein YitT, contains DUF161 and DUF2179 domains [Clostridium collagenovorans DSM 3089]|uniref:Uncharacterized membrane-anchored protein YitT, contains DUF161 and DUF2179 domains n=1 Tax=Clostridium collagenovorans DSM 3089 TaxID=1121306 RepID=A0A1M5W7I6_9CLOT|nr:YitT family protein [Clostridium collagenovorans]SHH83425.1 Uncharacterized membrane-anchored protein YitT, contains DUF161 and DUF2179 domains [Clostridium collagenovorans DSM 3089]
MSEVMEDVELNKRGNRKKLIVELLMIMLGNLILSLGLNWFLSPSDLVVGGITGVSIILDYLVNIPMWVTNIIVNLPLFLIAAKQLGFKFIAKSAFSAGFLSVALWFTGFIPPLVEDPGMLMNAVYGAIFLGVGIGIVLRASATTGGTDMAATIIHTAKKNFPLAKIMLCIDSTIIAIGAAVFGVEKAMYALIAVYIISRVVSTIIDGGDLSKSVLIVSDKHEELGKSIISRLKRGATSLRGTGMYTQHEKNLLYVVVRKNEIVELQKIVKEIDPKAFMTIMEAKEVIGEGFRDY